MGIFWEYFFQHRGFFQGIRLDFFLGIWWDNHHDIQSLGGAPYLARLDRQQGHGCKGGPWSCLQFVFLLWFLFLWVWLLLHLVIDVSSFPSTPTAVLQLRRFSCADWDRKLRHAECILKQADWASWTSFFALPCWETAECKSFVSSCPDRTLTSFIKALFISWQMFMICSLRRRHSA